MSRQSTSSTRPLLVGSIVVAVLATLLGIAVGFATEVVGLLVDEEWVRAHRREVLVGFGALAVVSLVVAVYQARRAHAVPHRLPRPTRRPARSPASR